MENVVDAHARDTTGLVYLRARVYDPAQFLSVDPLIDTTHEPYAYTDGDPTNTTDSRLADCLPRAARRLLRPYIRPAAM